MRLPIDTSVVKFASPGLPEPVLDFETRQPKTDEHGVPLFNIPVFAAGTGVKNSITIKVAGEVKGLSEFTLVKVSNLIAVTWEVGANHGVSFRADRVEILKAQA